MRVAVAPYSRTADAVVWWKGCRCWHRRRRGRWRRSSCIQIKLQEAGADEGRRSRAGILPRVLLAQLSALRRLGSVHGRPRPRACLCTTTGQLAPTGKLAGGVPTGAPPPLLAQGFGRRGLAVVRCWQRFSAAPKRSCVNCRSVSWGSGLAPQRLQLPQARSHRGLEAPKPIVDLTDRARRRLRPPRPMLHGGSS